MDARLRADGPAAPFLSDRSAVPPAPSAQRQRRGAASGARILSPSSAFMPYRPCATLRGTQPLPCHLSGAGLAQAPPHEGRDSVPSPPVAWWCPACYGTMPSARSQNVLAALFSSGKAHRGTARAERVRAHTRLPLSRPSGHSTRVHKAGGTGRLTPAPWPDLSSHASLRRMHAATREARMGREPDGHKTPAKVALQSAGCCHPFGNPDAAGRETRRTRR